MMTMMNNSTVNFTNGASGNSTTQLLGLMDYLQISLYSINLFFGFPTQSYVFWLIVTGTNRVSSEILNLNLCLCEFGICLNSLVLILSMWFVRVSKFGLFLLGFSISGRPLFQCLMCVERYLAVVHPVTFLKYKPLRYRVICSAVVWMLILFSCVFGMFYLISQITYICTWWLTLQMTLVISIQLFCLVAVLRALKQSGPGERKREENHMKRRAIQIILITTVNAVFMYVPKAITGFYEILSGDTNNSNMFTGFAFFILTGFAHPVLYLHRIGKLSCSCLPWLWKCVYTL